MIIKLLAWTDNTQGKYVFAILTVHRMCTVSGKLKAVMSLFFECWKNKLLSYANENDNVNENGNIDLKNDIVYKNDNSADCY